MKFLRIIAMLMAVMLCLAACAAKEETNDVTPTEAPVVTEEPTAEPAEETADSTSADSASYESFMIKSLNLTYESWMTEEMRSVFAATFFMDIAYCDAFGITQLSTELGIPTVYVGELQGDNYGNGMNLALFFTDTETSETTMVNATVYLKTGLFDGYVTTDAGDPAAMMDSLVENGTLQVCHAISADEFMSAYAMLTQAITSQTTATPAE